MPALGSSPHFCKNQASLTTRQLGRENKSKTKVKNGDNDLVFFLLMSLKN